MSIEFTLSTISLVSFYVISIIVFTILKSCLKIIDKQSTLKTIKFAIRKNQRKRVNIIKIDALSQCSSIVFIAFVACEINNY